MSHTFPGVTFSYIYTLQIDQIGGTRVWVSVWTIGPPGTRLVNSMNNFCRQSVAFNYQVSCFELEKMQIDGLKQVLK